MVDIHAHRRAAPEAVDRSDVRWPPPRQTVAPHLPVTRHPACHPAVQPVAQPRILARRPARYRSIISKRLERGEDEKKAQKLAKSLVAGRAAKLLEVPTRAEPASGAQIAHSLARAGGASLNGDVVSIIAAQAHAANEQKREQLLNTAIANRRAQTDRAGWDTYPQIELILSRDPDPAKHNRINLRVFEHELSCLVRFGAPMDKAKAWLREQAELLRN